MHHFNVNDGLCVFEKQNFFSLKKVILSAHKDLANKIIWAIDNSLTNWSERVKTIFLTLKNTHVPSNVSEFSPLLKPVSSKVVAESGISLFLSASLVSGISLFCRFASGLALEGDTVMGGEPMFVQ